MNKPNKRLALSQSMLDNITMAGDLDMAYESGAHALALWAPMVRKTGAQETVRLLRERNLGVTSIHLGLKVLELEDATADAVLREGVELAASVGAPIAPVSPGSCGEQMVATADDVYVRRLARVAPLAKELGVTMVIEPLHPFLHAIGYIHTIRHAARVVSRVENCGIVLDVAHLYWDGDLYDDIKAHIQKLSLVQLANLDKEALAQRRWGRALLHAGVVPIADIVREVDAAGYQGAYESEILLDLPHRECIEAARASRVWFDQIWQAPESH